ncbi:hypothetical protein [Sporosarcina sp. E16_8]|uniref:hypothetical protein n=1 Tax=Sporosarcina sp. E16_8 TaxID=2789295 RepID=UPI001A939CD1|nr:hypothetical protein [Sporosarcina sp. E16_8]MBO0586140.1 hypothetical protein [Sporosarcina sp. E16_8]
MRNEWETPKLPTTLMCVDCKGIGTLGGSSYITESCPVCKGTGMIQKEVEAE